MPSISDAVAALELNSRRIERAKIELEAAQAEKKELERIVLPPLFTAARSKSFTLDNGTIATKRMGCWARFPDVEPKKSKTIEWLTSVGHESAIKAQLQATWGRGDYQLALDALAQLGKDKSCVAMLREDVHWATYQKIVLETVKGGKHIVPFDDINAEVFDEVTITKYGDEPTEAK